ncbi:MAG TPA: 50S ribosomal protein L11 methyltransferase [Nitrospira sp.]|nr:50S ribosomal protein L11 methyltransferase [Nitrospira sp.]
MSSTISDWVDVQIRSSLDAGELLGRLDDPSVQGAWQDEGMIHLYWPSRSWSPDHLVRLRQILLQMDAAGQPVPEMLIQSMPNQDWNRQWAQSVKPLWIGRRIVIRPSWETVVLTTGQIEIVLDPKQAFGTGHHATTRMLVEWLEETIRGGEKVLDVGTGSGLLAMVALRLGASRALGIDNDPVAIDCAKEYARENRFGAELALDCGTLDDDSVFDLVVANLDRQTLLQLAERLSASTGSSLLVSGLLLDQRAEIVEAFARVNLYPGQQRELDGWLAMEFAHAQSCEGV